MTSFEGIQETPMFTEWLVLVRQDCLERANRSTAGLGSVLHQQGHIFMIAIGASGTTASKGHRPDIPGGALMGSPGG